MAISTSISHEKVKQYMEDSLGETASKLSLTVAEGSFDLATDQVLYFLNLEDFSSIITQALVKKVLLVAKVEVWRQVMESTAHEASFSAGSPGTGQTNRSDIFRQAKSIFEMTQRNLFDLYPDLDPSENRTEANRKPKKYKVVWKNDKYHDPS